MISQYPESSGHINQTKAITEMESVFELIRAVRNIRGEFKLNPRDTLGCQIVASSPSNRVLLLEESESIKSMAGIRDLEIPEESIGKSSGVTINIVVNIGTAQLSLGETIDVETEFERLTEEKKSLNNYLESISKRLSNPGFVDNAPPEVVEKERDRLARSNNRMERLQDILQKFSLTN